MQVKDAKFSEVPEEANSVRVAYLPPMSGLADREFIKQPGEIGFLVGQGQTAQVLRNMCYQIYSGENKSNWEEVVRHILDLFGVKLNPPKYIWERSEILMDYDEKVDEMPLRWICPVRAVASSRRCSCWLICMRTPIPCYSLTNRTPTSKSSDRDRLFV